MGGTRQPKMSRSQSLKMSITGRILVFSDSWKLSGRKVDYN